MRRLTWTLAAATGLLVSAACGTPETVEPASGFLAAPAVSAPADGSLAQIVGAAPPANGGIVSIVLLDPHSEVEVPMPREVPVMDQYGRAFNPAFLMVRRGQTIEFTNSEDDLHTVHVKDSAGESLFNVATMVGFSYEFTFDDPGSYDVMCNTHTEMAADILVVSSPYAVLADRDGAFAVPDVVPGAYTVTLMNGADRREREVEVVAGRNEIDLTAF